MQAERIPLLAGVLDRAEPSSSSPRKLPTLTKSYSRNASNAWQDYVPRIIHHPDIPTKIQNIYETPTWLEYMSYPIISRNLPPSFLQHIVCSPALSLSESTSFSQTGLEDRYSVLDMPVGASYVLRPPYSSRSASLLSTSTASIWTLDETESEKYGIIRNIYPIGTLSPLPRLSRPSLDKNGRSSLSLCSCFLS